MFEMSDRQFESHQEQVSALGAAGSARATGRRRQVSTEVKRLVRFRDGNEGLTCVEFQDFGKLQKFDYIHPSLPTLKSCHEGLIFAELRSEIRLRKSSGLTFFD